MSSDKSEKNVTNVEHYSEYTLFKYEIRSSKKDFPTRFNQVIKTMEVTRKIVYLKRKKG